MVKAKKQKAMTGAKKQKANLGTKILEMLGARDAGKAGYAKSDELLEEIVAEMLIAGNDGDVVLGDGQIAKLVDNFAKGNKAWKPCGISRYDIKVTRTE